MSEPDKYNILTEEEFEKLLVENRRPRAENARLQEENRRLRKSVDRPGPFGYRERG